MKIRMIALTALLTNSLIGQVCMMPIAHAAEPMHMEMDEHTTMLMTPAVPMSRVIDGPVLKSAPLTSIPCSGGHCMSQGIPMVAGLSTAAGYVLIAAMVLGAMLITWKILEDLPLQQALSPPFVLGTETVVLRL